MKFAVGGGRFEGNLRAGILLCLLLTICSLVACSVPNLEKPQCTEARNALKRFYSIHVGSDMKPSQENLKAREMYLTADLYNMLSMRNAGPIDYFTSTAEYPRAFRVGECESGLENAATLQVLLLWRDDTSSEQKSVRVETVKSGDRWLVNKVSD